MNSKYLATITTFLFLNMAIASEPEFIWSKDFFGDGISNTRTLPIGVLDGNNEGFVGATGNAVPRRFINANNDLECHILIRYQNGIMSTTGNIHDNNSDNCPLLSGSFPIRAVEAFGTDICIGGDFTNLGGIKGLNYFACYSNSLGWYQPNGIGNGPNGSVYAIEADVNGSSVYLGGAFTQVNMMSSQDSARRIVRTDGLSWTPLFSDPQETSNGVNTTVYSILPTTNFIHVGSGTTLLSWNSSIPEWQDRGTHNGGVQPIRDMVSFGSTVTASTPTATMVSGHAAGSISEVVLGDNDWSETGSSLDMGSHFGQLAFGLGPLYGSGDFTHVDADAKGVAVFIGNDWQAVPGAQMLGDLNNFRVLEMQQGGLSQFCMLTQGPPDDAEIYWRETVCYNGDSWSGVKNAPIYGNTGRTGDITKFQGNIILAGAFEFIGDKRSNYVAKLKSNNRWESISQLEWSSTGNPYVRHLAEYNGFLYATGLFNMANGEAVNQIAKWDGTNWTPAIPGFIATSNSPMIVWNNKLVVSGLLNGISSVISWDGSTIEHLEGLFGANYFEVYQGDLIANGGSGVVKYNNDGTWTDLVSNVSVVSALKVDGDDLYVGGNFNGVCSGGLFISAKNIMRWDGNTCFALGEGLEDTSSSFDAVNEMAVLDGNLIVVGRFDTAGNTNVNNLAYWDGTNWNSIGQGLVDASGSSQLYLDGNDLYLYGGFAQAGDALVGGFAKVELILDRLFKNGFE
ncbi:MAG: hypothetical protein AB8B80_04445 [Marinicellaceae bacterium]